MKTDNIHEAKCLMESDAWMIRGSEVNSIKSAAFKLKTQSPQYIYIYILLNRSAGSGLLNAVPPIFCTICPSRWKTTMPSDDLKWEHMHDASFIVRAAHSFIRLDFIRVGRTWSSSSENLRWEHLSWVPPCPTHLTPSYQKVGNWMIKIKYKGTVISTTVH